MPQGSGRLVQRRVPTSFGLGPVISGGSAGGRKGVPGSGNGTPFNFQSASMCYFTAARTQDAEWEELAAEAPSTLTGGKGQPGPPPAPSAHFRTK